jgi:hypothetical protein
MRFAGAGIALHEQARGEKLLKIKHGLLATAQRRCRSRTATSDGTHVDTDLHLASLIENDRNRRLARPCRQSISIRLTSWRVKCHPLRQMPTDAGQ